MRFNQMSRGQPPLNNRYRQADIDKFSVFQNFSHLLSLALQFERKRLHLKYLKCLSQEVPCLENYSSNRTEQSLHQTKFEHMFDKQVFRLEEVTTCPHMYRSISAPCLETYKNETNGSSLLKATSKDQILKDRSSRSQPDAQSRYKVYPHQATKFYKQEKKTTSPTRGRNNVRLRIEKPDWLSFLRHGFHNPTPK